jgi:hypothetical protein
MAEMFEEQSLEGNSHQAGIVSKRQDGVYIYFSLLNLLSTLDNL